MRVSLFATLALAAGLIAAPTAAAQAAPTTDVRAGMEIRVPESIITDAECTLGAVLSRTQALTAGHCGNPGQAVYNAADKRIGTIRSNLVGTRLDVAVVRLAPGTNAHVDDIDWSGRFVTGQRISKDGVTTGHTAGQITDPKPTLRHSHGFSLAPPFLKNDTTYSVAGRLRSDSGDSGAGIRDGAGRVIGILSAGSGGETVFAPLSRIPANLR